MCWDGVDAVAEAAAPGTVVDVAGRYSRRRALRRDASRCAAVRAGRADGEYDPADLHEAPPIPFDADGAPTCAT